MARPRFSDRSQNPPRAASESAMRITALTPTRPARRRSLTVSPRMKPTTNARARETIAERVARSRPCRGVRVFSPFVLDEMAARQREGATLQLTHDPGLMSGQEHGGA